MLEVNIKIFVVEIGWEVVDWIHLAQVTNQRWDERLGISWRAKRVSASQEGLRSKDVVDMNMYCLSCA